MKLDEAQVRAFMREEPTLGRIQHVLQHYLEGEDPHCAAWFFAGVCWARDDPEVAQYWRDALIRGGVEAFPAEIIAHFREAYEGRKAS